MIDRETISQAFQDLLGREPESESTFVNFMQSCNTWQDLYESIIKSAEFQERNSRIRRGENVPLPRSKRLGSSTDEDRDFVQTVSFPRSGHHALMRCLQHYFGADMNYCIYYTCCQQIPCPHARARFNFQKNHDFVERLPLTPDPKQRYLVQYRNPVDSLISNCYLYEKGTLERESTRSEWEAFAENWLNRWQRFVHKWALDKPPLSEQIAYEEFIADPKETIAKVVSFVDPRSEPDRAFIAAVVKRLKIESRSSLQRFRHYDESFLDSLERRVEPEMSTLGLPSYKTVCVQ
jgi:hypothetical protein